jgi:transcriptional regulator with XRE-family HTH domain
MAFPDNLRRLRHGQFLSQAELARRAKLHPLTVTRLEAGSTAPSTRTIRALASALGIEPGELASPHEVAELRSVFLKAAQPDNDDSDRLDTWNDDGGTAAAGQSPHGPADTAPDVAATGPDVVSRGEAP